MLLISLLSCSDGSALTAGTLPASSGDTQPDVSDSSAGDETGGVFADTDTSECAFDPGDSWTIGASSYSLDFAHRGAIDFTMSDLGARIGSGPIDTAVVGGGNLYLDGRLGVETNYWMKQPYGTVAAFSTATGNDHFALYAENESGDANELESVSVYAAAVTPRTSPRANVAGWFTAANAPGGNIGARVDAQYSPDVSPPNQTLQLREMSGDTPLYVAYYNPTYIDAHDGAYAVAGFDVRLNGTAAASFTSSGIYSEGFQIWSSKTLKTDITPISDADREQIAREVRGINVVRFHYKDDPNGKLHVGLIAEDAPRGIVDAEGKAVRLPEAVAYLVASNQQLASENAEMRSELDALRRDVERMKLR